MELQLPSYGRGVEVAAFLVLQDHRVGQPVPVVVLGFDRIAVSLVRREVVLVGLLRVVGVFGVRFVGTRRPSGRHGSTPPSRTAHASPNT